MFFERIFFGLYKNAVCRKNSRIFTRRRQLKICIEWDFKSSSIKKIGPNIGPCKNVPKLVQCCNILYLLPNFLGGGIGEGIQVLISCYKAYNLRNFVLFCFLKKNIYTRLTRKCRLFSIYTADFFVCFLL